MQSGDESVAEDRVPVLVSTTLYPAGDEGAKEKLPYAVRDLVESAVNVGLDVRAVVRFLPALDRHGPNWPSVKSLGGLRVLTCPRIGARDLSWPFPTRVMFRHLFKLDTQEPSPIPEIIVCHSAMDFYYSWPFLKHLSARWVYVVHGSDFKHPEAVTFASRRATRILARSRALSVSLEQHTGAMADGVAFSGVAIPSIRRQERRTGETLKLISACKLGKIKNVDAVIRAVALSKERYPKLDIRFDIYGTGDMRHELEDLSIALGIGKNVKFHGHVEQGELFEAMSEAHLFAMPSAPETFGLAFLEAMAHGCVVIGHRGWGIDGIVEDGVNGFLVSEASAERVAEKISVYLSDDGAILRESLASVAQYTKLAAAKNYREQVELAAG